ncbi:MAG: response regulator transcription factor [Planctomycetes bacterium]|nr:response regulator transcription factor [Planctomycetota bacterium]
MKILLVDDHRLFRDGLRPLLGRERGFEVVGEAGDGTEAVRLVASLAPDVVLMDVTMPGLSGIEATRAIVANHPTTKVVILTMHADKRYVTEALKAGASGYLLKDAAFSDLVQALRIVEDGRIHLSPRVAEMVVEDYAHLARQSPPSEGPLSTREREVLQAMAAGHSTKEIAFHLGISVKTAETHRRQIMEKLDLHSVAELTKYAIREGLSSLS